jgi:hypothetical protein
VKEGASDPSRLSWDDDTADGSFAMSSEAMLLDWLKTPGNYQTWRGNDRGITKLAIQQEIANSINAEGLRQNINRQRTEKQVGAKIAHMEQKFRSTLSFMECTGQGIKDEKNLSDDKFITKQWSHFWDLFDIMADRSCMIPVSNTEEIGVTADDSKILGGRHEEEANSSICSSDSSEDIILVSVHGGAPSLINKDTAEDERSAPSGAIYDSTPSAVTHDASALTAFREL